MMSMLKIYLSKDSFILQKDNAGCGIRHTVNEGDCAMKQKNLPKWLNINSTIQLNFDIYT